MLFGGMWPVALTDFFRMIIIVVGMLYIGWVVSGYAGDVGNVVASIYKTVENAYKITLVAAFVPLVSSPILETCQHPGRAVRHCGGCVFLAAAGNLPPGWRVAAAVI